MKRIILILTLLFFITNKYALTDSNAKSAKNKSKWSDYQGIMTWDEANAKCSSLGMRLPTKAAFKLPILIIKMGIIVLYFHKIIIQTYLYLANISGGIC